MNIKWMINNENKLIRWMQGVGGLRTEMSEYDIARIIHLQCPLCCRDPTWGGGGWSLGRRRCQEEWRHACHSDLIFTSSLTPSSHGCMLGVVKNGPKSCCPMYWEVIWHIKWFPGWFPALELACHSDLIFTSIMNEPFLTPSSHGYMAGECKNGSIPPSHISDESLGVTDA